ncbi:MFS transporter [Deinococcus multiflagellatus]|uniref:MFS transporter n=1 Tax=Deinococcus multiflagellatus TaxID=1656887 RepID=UPI001CCF2504|nr:MFS transporter [Deinococcus multiflagellatus]MBZ9712545.1 MFS transporter [Deinococcus multiflagellatus]
MNAAPTPSVPLSWPLLATGAAAFFTLGVIQAMYGPAFGLFEARYGVSTATVGLIASAHFLGSACAPLPVGLLLRRLSARAGTSWSLLVLALGMVGVVLAPTWPLAVAAAAVGGLGLGGVSACMNAAYASVGARAVNLVNAVFGVGSLMSPLLVAGLGAGLAAPFLTVAALCAATFVVGRVWGVPEIVTRRPETAPARPGVQAGLLAALLVAYVGMEAGYGAWIVRYLTGHGVGGAALILSLFWGALTVGRVLTGVFGGRVAPHRLLLACAAALITLAALALVPAWAPVAFLGAGLALAPVFGTTLAWASQTLSARLVPLLLVAGSVGGVLAPAALGALLARFGLAAVPLGLGTLALLMGAFTLLARRGLRPGAAA